MTKCRGTPIVKNIVLASKSPDLMIKHAAIQLFMNIAHFIQFIQPCILKSHLLSFYATFIFVWSLDNRYAICQQYRSTYIKLSKPVFITASRRLSSKLTIFSFEIGQFHLSDSAVPDIFERWPSKVRDYHPDTLNHEPLKARCCTLSQNTNDQVTM